MPPSPPLDLTEASLPSSFEESIQDDIPYNAPTNLYTLLSADVHPNARGPPDDVLNARNNRYQRAGLTSFLNIGAFGTYPRLSLKRMLNYPC